MDNSFYTASELSEIGLLSIGERVLISRKASIYSPSTISIGNNVRIDDFCILSGSIEIGSNIHIAAYSAIYGHNRVVLEDFSGLSARVTIYSAMDDFSGEYLIGPIHGEGKVNVQGGLVHINKYVQIGASSIIFPNIEIGEGSIIGCFSLVKASVGSWGIYAGIPVKRIKDRSKNLISLVY